jgi:NAD(P)-dependent dehydrogenase (short-subunit alcohol dehydrogenase family)
MEKTMDFGLKGKVALVTGTASQVGMGKAICLTLAKEGCDIISADIDLEGAKKTADAVKAQGGKAIALKVNIAKPAEVEEMVKAAVKEYKKIDILVNTAGLIAALGTPFIDSKQESWEKDMAVNLYGAMNCAKSVLPGMVARQYGKIINFSSVAAKVGGLGSYSAAKAGISSITRGLATEFGPSGININAIAPGVVATNLFAAIGAGADESYKALAARTPMRRVQSVDDMAKAVAFLASDISKNITGQTIQIDGGQVL